METRKYYLNQETQKIELRDLSKEEYLSLSEELKKEVKGAYLIGKNGWVSRSKNNHYRAIRVAEKLGFTEQEIVGEKFIKQNEEDLQLQDYTEININDIENYIVPAELSKRENSVSMFRRNETNHTRELQKVLQSANDDILELIEMGCNKYIEYKAKTYLQSFKRKYTDQYISILNHRANNPSWVITGRSGLNVNRYNKKQEQLHNKEVALCQLIDDFNARMKQYKNMIKKEKQQEIKKVIEQQTNNITTLPKFKRVRVKINGDATAYNNIFNIENASYIADVTAHQFDSYSIIKNWGAFRIYKNGQEVHSMKTNESLENAKKYVTYLLGQEKQVV